LEKFEVEAKEEKDAALFIQDLMKELIGSIMISFN